MVSNFKQEIYNAADVDLVIHDLVDGNSLYIEDYLTIYQELFPQYVRYLPVMRQRAGDAADKSSIEKWHQWLLVIHDKPVGIIGFMYNRKRNIGLLMDFAIYPAARKLRGPDGSPFAKFVLGLAMQKLVEDARENAQIAPICMAAEVEYPRLLTRYTEYGYVRFAVEYFEPPSTPELEKVGDKIQALKNADFGKMNIGAFQIPGYERDLGDAHTIKLVLLAFLEDHYQLSLDHWLVRKVIQEISA